MLKKLLTFFVTGLLTATVSWAQPRDRANDLREWTTANGVRVLFLAAPEIPMVYVS